MALSPIQLQAPSPYPFGISHMDKDLSKSASMNGHGAHSMQGRRRRSRQMGRASSPVIAAQNACTRRARSPQVDANHGRPAPAHSNAPAGEDAKMMDSTPPPSPTKLVLPRRLPRPLFRDIEPSRLTAINADLEGVPLDYLQDNLATVGPQLLSVLAGAVPDNSFTTLPTEMQVQIQDPSFDMPTHVFAVHASGSPSKQRKVTLFPAHNLVFAAHCAALPELPPSKPSRPEEPNSKITIPVVPLCIPSPETFPILQSYIYSKRTDLLLASLLPLPPSPDAPSIKAALDEVAHRLASTFTLPALLEHARKVHALWQNVCVLQVFDERLFSAMEISWAVITNAMAVATGQALGLPSQATMDSA